MADNSKIGVRVFLTLSAIAGAVVGVLWYYATRIMNEAILAGGITFIVSLVVVATLHLMTKDDVAKPADQPRLK